ncbi:MAG: peptidylprolyl isomerase [Oxalobacter sp.]|nr:MAG: peptidylprolyl isomerase [Oxalobacter sp.]
MNLRIVRLLAASCAFLTLPVLAQTLATVNGKAIPASRANAIIKQLVAHGQKDTPELRNMIKNELVMREVLMQEANRKKIASKPDVKMQIDSTRETIIINALRADFAKKHPVTDDDISKEYDRYKKAAGDTDYRIRHILLANEADAKDVIAKLKDGGNFEDLAKEKSKDTVSAQKGGDIDWGNPSKYVKPFSDAMVKLSKGQYTETPVQTDFGYHVIKLEDTRPSAFPALEEVKPQVAKAVTERRLKEYFDGLFKKAKVK